MKGADLPLHAKDPAVGMKALIEAHDWAATPLGSSSAWPETLRAFVGTMLSSRLPMFLLWGTERIMLYNDAYAPILGARHPEALGRPFVRVWPGLAEEAGHVIDRAYGGEETPLGALTFAMRKTGYSGEVQFSFSCSPVRHGAGIEGLLWVCSAAAAEDPAERHLKFRLELDERLRNLNDPREVMAVAAEHLGRYLNASRANYGYVENTPSGEMFIVERDWTDGNTPSLVGRYRVEDFGAPLIDLLKAGHTVCLHDAFDDQLTAGKGIADTYVAIGARSGITVPLIKSGHVEAALLVHQAEPRHWREDEEALVRQVAERTWEAVERARVETALRESEERMRDILESVNDAFYAIDSEWRFTYVNCKTEELWSRERGDLMGQVYLDRFPEAAASDLYKAHVAAMESRRPVRLEVASANARQWLDVSIYPTADGGLSVYFRDITERKQAEEHRELLIHELNHRVKNTLATVQSIVAQTLRGGHVAGEIRSALEARIFALSRAHDVLTRENWEGAALHEIVAQALDPYRGIGEKRLCSAGPEVRLSPRIALALSMALQELVTNAVKHGALSNATGRIEIGWTLDGTAGPVRLRLRWEEQGGPSVKTPQRCGFGTRLIERSLAHDLQGEVAIDFAPTGLVCTIAVPLAGTDLSLLGDLPGKPILAT